MPSSSPSMPLLLSREWILPNKSFLLFGPRGTGKSTLIRTQLRADLEINLLKSTQFLPLSQNPNLLQEWTQHLKPGQWVFIDEVQKIPALLDEVHSLYEERKLHFALSGSSARKLKRGGANLLAGRALQSFLFPFTYSEYHSVATLSDVIDWGSLPTVIMDPENRAETLATYVETYLRQELVEEGLIRKLDPFIRFLKVAGLYHAQVLNIENLAREAKLGRTTLDHYFEILEDTLISYRLPAIQLGIHSKEVQHPKFYLFDTGVARACAGFVTETVDSIWRGFSFEAYILHELRAYNVYHQKRKDFFYYRVSGGDEIDVLIETKKKTLSSRRELLAIEIKNSTQWDRRWSKTLNEIGSESKTGIRKRLGIYRGSQILTQGEVQVYPVETFLQELQEGRIF